MGTLCTFLSFAQPKIVLKIKSIKKATYYLTIIKTYKNLYAFITIIGKHV